MRRLGCVFCAGLLSAVAIVSGLSRAAGAEQPWVVYDGGDGPGKGKSIVLVSGDEEYRSEEGLPQLGKILAKHHGFKCTVLFSIANDGTIDPNRHDNTPGLEALDTADLMIILTRFRSPPDEQMKHVVDYVNSGRPIIGLRTATHAFDGIKGTYAKYNAGGNKEWNGGFGRQILGETWVNHWGGHGSQSTLGIVVPGQEKNPFLRGIKSGDIWGKTDVYEVKLPMRKTCTPLVLGEVLEGMTPTSKPLVPKKGDKVNKNDPMMPIAWTNTYTSASGKEGHTFATTMGASQDLESAGLRHLIVNAVYCLLGMEDKLPEKPNVEIVGEYKPTKFGFNGWTKGMKPADFEMK